MKFSVNRRYSSTEIYDIETMANLFVYVGINGKTLNKNIFIIHQSKNDLDLLLKHLNSKINQVGYNNLGFDAQVLQDIINNKKYLLTLDGDQCSRKIYEYAQNAINASNNGGYPKYAEWKLSNPQLDLYKIYHYDNANRSTRLKDLEIAMKWLNVMDMPIEHTEFIYNQDDIDKVVEYCINDTEATLKFYQLSYDVINMRTELSKEFNLNLRNANDPKIGSEIFAKLLSEELNIPKDDLKKMRTFRSSIDLNDVILPTIKFSDKTFNLLLDKFKKTIIKNTKGDFKKSINSDGFKLEYGLGGIHGCISPGVYESDDSKLIMSCDVKSMYPNISISNNFYPEHLGLGFCKVFKDIYVKRSLYNKNDARNKGLKLSLNGAYGKSNELTSFLYDPKFTMQITVNGQLMLSMLIERLQLAGFTMLMANTDGLECYVNNNQYSINQYYDICHQWEKEVNLELEFTQYKKMVINNVNNYFSVDINDKIKYKGLFEIDKEYHKDPSFRIVALSLSEYFINNIKVEDTINKDKDMFNFYGRAKFKNDSYGEIRYIDHSTNTIVKQKQQKTTRYFVSNSQSVFYKVYKKGTDEVINKGYSVTIGNKHENNTNRNIIDERFYIDECNKIIDVIKPKIKQLNIFD